MTLSKLQVILDASTSAFNRKMEKAGKRLQAFKVKAANMGKTMMAMGPQIAAGIAAFAGLGVATKKIFDLGSAIAETQSKFDTVFGPEASAQVQEFLDGFANKAGLTNAEAQNLIATTGAIAQGMGFAQKESADFATEITKVSADLASFNNLPSERVIRAVSSALTGEAEAMKTLGIQIKQEEVTQLAMATTSKKVAKALTSQERATATLELITRKAGVQIGDLDRTQGSAANVAKRLGAGFKEIRDIIATALMPAFGDVLDWLTDAQGSFDNMKQAIKDNSDQIAQFGRVFFAWMKALALSMAVPIRALFNMGQMIFDVTRAMRDLVLLDWRSAKAHMGDFMKNMEDGLSSIPIAGEAIGDAINESLTLYGGSWEETEKAINNANEAMEEFVAPEKTDGLKKVTDKVDEVTKTVQTLNQQLHTAAVGFADDFIGRMISSANNGENALKGFFENMRKRIVAMTLEWLAFKALTSVFGDSQFVQELTGFTPKGTSADRAIQNMPQQSRRSIHEQTMKAGQTVNQTINFSVSAMDGRDASRFLQENKGTIASVVSDAARDSTGFRAQLLGGTG